MHASPTNNAKSRAPKSHDRGPPSKEDTQTDFAALNVLGNTPPPASGIDATTNDGFAFSNNTRLSGSGALLLGGEVYKWRPWLSPGRKEGTIAAGGKGDDAMTGRLKNAKGQWEPPMEGRPWGLLEVVWPKPDLLIIGTGPGIVPISPATRRYINDLGIRIEVQDTRNAASQYNLLATERGIQQVAAALIPMGWKEGR
jgi:NADH dehydrogenase [ubiquinone] 1 alpha subcomplex assembly factor 3